MTDEATIYYDDDAQREQIENKTVAVLGYGSQGHAHAQNLADSGVNVVVGLKEESSSRDAVQEDGLSVGTPKEAAAQADIVSVLVPDTIQPTVYEEIREELEPGNTLQFAHGFNIHYNQINPPEDVDVTMIAPKTPGHILRRNYENDEGTPALLAVYQDTTGEAKDEALAYAQAIGCTRAGVVETSFREETETDLFGEQAVLCGGVSHLVQYGFETLVEAGYQPEIAYFECLHELKLIVDLMYENGIWGQRYSISDTAEYGDLTRGPRIVNNAVKEEMRKILGEIQDGSFAREWVAEDDNGRPNFQKLEDEGKAHQIEQVGAKLRGLMPWMARPTN